MKIIKAIDGKVAEFDSVSSFPLKEIRRKYVKSSVK